MSERAANQRLVAGTVAGIALWFVAVLTYRILSGPAQASTPQPETSPQAFVSPMPAAPAPAVLPLHLRPGYNFALAKHGGTARGGTRPEEVIDGNSSVYTGGDGFCYTNWSTQPPGVLEIELKEVSKVDCIRFLLWDLDDRFYRYKLEVAKAADAKEWTLIADKTTVEERCTSWQTHRFPVQEVKVIRLTGTYNSANSGFHVVELEACIYPAEGFKKERVPTQLPSVGTPDGNWVF